LNSKQDIQYNYAANNIAKEFLPFPLHILIWTYPFYFQSVILHPQEIVNIVSEFPFGYNVHWVKLNMWRVIVVVFLHKAVNEASKVPKAPTECG